MNRQNKRHELSCMNKKRETVKGKRASWGAIGGGGGGGDDSPLTLTSPTSENLHLLAFFHLPPLTLTSPLQKSSSTISFTSGSRPAWCTPMPRFSISTTRPT